MTRSLLVLAAFFVLLVSSAQAVSYPPASPEPTTVKEEEMMKVGDKLYLFHSGTADVKEAIRINDVLTVFRESPKELAAEVASTGKVKIIATVGDYYFEAEVVEGSVGFGNLAVKSNTACLITGRAKRR